MKKLIILAMVCLFAASATYAQQATTKKKAGEPIAVKTVETKEMTGKVKVVTAANQAKGTKSEITVADEKSGEMVFLVTPTTTVYDADFKAIGLDKIKAGEKVKVKYGTTKEGVKEAVSINLLK
jgi:hypothetical protein